MRTGPEDRGGGGTSAVGIDIATSQCTKENVWETAFEKSYLRLHHVGAVEPQVKDGAVNVHRVFGVQLLQHSVQDDEGPCATHTSTGTHVHT